jgi:DNA/RNA-binding domain of Phe-tRNA-synthetase-like protein
MLSISATDAWRNAHPGAAIGLLELSEVISVPASPALEQRKRETEKALRERYANFTRPDFLALPVMAAYNRYYRRFDKTYHVLQQVESLVLKGRDLPMVAPLVDANFVAEVDSLVLTAGHDADRLEGQILIDVAGIGEQMLQMNGSLKTLLAGDMLMRDSHGICCSILYGQDNVSALSPQSSHVLYVAYVPAGVSHEHVNTHLNSIRENILLFSPHAVLEQQRLLLA